MQQFGDCIRKTTFPRLKKNDLASPIAAEISHYCGPKKPPMPSLPKSNLDETFFKMQAVSRARAEEIDFDFLTILYQKRSAQCTMGIAHV